MSASPATPGGGAAKSARAALAARKARSGDAGRLLLTVHAAGKTRLAHILFLSGNLLTDAAVGALVDVIEAGALLDAVCGTSDTRCGASDAEWIYATGGPVSSSPAIDASGVVYVVLALARKRYFLASASGVSPLFLA